MATGGRIFDTLVPNFGTFAGTADALESTTGTWAGWVKNLDESVAAAFVEALDGSFNGYRYTWERGGFAQRFTLFDTVDWRFSGTVTNGDLADGDWHHIAVTWVSGGDVKFYMDGVQVGTTATAGTMVNAGGSTKYFGRDDSTYIDGEFSEWAFWSSELSGTDIANLAGGDSPQAVGTPVGHWRFNGTGTTVSDEVGSLDLTLSHDLAQSSNGPTVDEPPSGGGGSILLLVDDAGMSGLDDMGAR